MKTRGKTDWAIAGGRIPSQTTGQGPALISHEKIAVLNTTDEEAVIEIDIFYEDEKPAGSWEIKVGARRVRKIRFNDLIDPATIRLDRNYGCSIRSSVPVVIQFSKMNTGQSANAEMSSLAFPAEAR
jgi:hypothetical protein